MNEIDWDKIDLTKPTGHILKLLAKRGTPRTKQAVTAARKVRGIASPTGHGGKRARAGTKSWLERNQKD